MATLLLTLLQVARPRQWLKNLALFATITFTGQLNNLPLLLLSLSGFFAYCFLASSNYILNDILDAQSDRKHPLKRARPIASGKLNINLAFISAILLAIFGLLISSLLGFPFFILACVFLALQYSYSLFLKKISIIDIIVIATGYIIRVYAGEAISGYHISVWLALAVLSLSLFLAIGKRRSELTLIQRTKSILPPDTRISLSHYTEKLLDTYTAMFANSTFIAYSFYTFLERPLNPGLLFRGYEALSSFSERKWLMSTIPFVVLGIMRYMQLIYEGKGESPEKILTSDRPLLLLVLMWFVSILMVVYLIGR